MNKKKYIAPKIEVFNINVEMCAASTTSLTRDSDNENSIKNANEILTKERSIFDNNGYEDSAW